MWCSRAHVPVGAAFAAPAPAGLPGADEQGGDAGGDGMRYCVHAALVRFVAEGTALPVDAQVTVGVGA